MNDQDLKKAILDAISSVAPEADTTGLDDAADLRDELDLDSMDFLAIVTALHDSLGVTIPESDYAAIGTLGGAVAYLRGKVGGPGSC